MTTSKKITVTLEELAAVGLVIEQGQTNGRHSWFVNQTMGPYDSKEAALLAGIGWLYTCYNDYRPMWDDCGPTAHLRGAQPLIEKHVNGM